jgi:uncharacterized damage-inducible protein DinB
MQYDTLGQANSRLSFVVMTKTLLDELLEAWRYTRSGVIAELEIMPAASFDAAPAGLRRSPLDLANHIVEAGRLMAGELSRANGDFKRKPDTELVAEHARPGDRANTQREALALLQRSLDEGVGVLKAAGMDLMSEPIRQFNGVYAPRIVWMHHGIAHEEYHRGQLALYARLSGVTPALTRRIHGE